MSNNIARLGVVMGLDTAEFTTGLGKVEKQLSSFKDKLMEFASVAAFVEMTKKAMEYADTITTTAKANDVTTASVLELSKALEENGGNAEETGRIYAGFNQKVETAALGSAKAQESFARLGVSLNDIKTLSSQDLFEKTITGLAKIQDSVTRNGIAFQTLGKGIRGVDIVGLAQTLEEAKGSFDRYAEAVNMAHELHLKIEASGRKVTLMFTEAVIPTLLVVYNEFTKTGSALDYVASGLKYLVVGFAIWGEAAVTAVKYVIDTIKMLAYTVNDLLTLSIDKAIEHFKGGLAEIKKDGSDYIEFLQKLKKANTEASGGGPINDAANRAVIESNAKKLGLAQGLTAEYKRQADLQIQMAIQARELLGLTKDEQVVQAEVNKVIDANQKARDAIDKQIAAARGQGSAGATLIKEYEKQKAAILDLRTTYIQSAKDQIQATIDFQRTFSFGWKTAWDQFAEDANNSAKEAEQIFSSVTTSMTNALDTFITTGKLNFSQFTLSIIQDIMKIEARMLMMKAITGIGNALSGGLFAGGASTPGGAYSADFMTAAGGGDIPAGQATLVGENGPEFIRPAGSSTVIPNNQLNGMGGATNVTNNYIQAIDTKSFEDRLYGSNKAIWAANQYANKNLSTSRSRT
jgi:lambda family phage tail tape measure protein